MFNVSNKIKSCIIICISIIFFSNVFAKCKKSGHCDHDSDCCDSYFCGETHDCIYKLNKNQKEEVDEIVEVGIDAI